jgi:hypothetical protein
MKKITIHVEEPLVLDFRPGVSNEHGTLDYIPATRLRGMLYEALLKPGTGIDPEQLFGFGGPRWTNALPADQDGMLWAPLPKCKAKPPSRGKEKQTGWGVLMNDTLHQRNVATEIHMSVGRDYERRAHRQSALYARTAVSPGQSFVAYVDVDDNILPNDSFQWNIGTRHSANGRCTVIIESINETFTQLADTHGASIDWPADCVAIQLLSDAIVPGANGGYLRGLNADAFERLAGCEVNKVLAAYSSSKVVAGWSGKWNMPRESAIAIEAGSVWLVRFDNQEGNERAAFMARCRESGLGIRTYEGFGSLAINPAWLLYENDHGNDDLRYRYAPWQPVENIRDTKTAGYPGLSALTHENLRLLSESAKNRAIDVRNKNPDQEASEARKWITAIAREEPLEALQSLSEYLIPYGTDSIVNTLPDGTPKREALLFFLSVFEAELQSGQAPVVPVQEAET